MSSSHLSSISVVIPTRDRAAVLARAIDSVLEQRCSADEIIVIDDGSSDETRDVASDYKGRITFVRQDPRGVSAARNLGVAMSKSRFVAFLDSDDVWYEGHLAAIDAALEATSGRALLYFADMTMPAGRGAGSIWQQSEFDIAGRYELREDARDWLFLSRQPMLIPASIVRKDAFQAVGGFDESLRCREDTDLFFRLGLNGPVCAVAEAAGEVTEDCSESLTRSFSATTEIYERCTARLYDSLLHSPSSLDPAQRKVAAMRSAAAYLSLARMSGPRHPAGFLGQFLRAWRRDPVLVSSRLYKRATLSGRARIQSARALTGEKSW